ncbi:MAG: hypothetical protein PVI99_02695 [Anaerolineales bacterium]|jgi:hypothetical protein
MQSLDLTIHTANDGTVEILGDGHWRLSCPVGDSDSYQLAQLDDYHRLKRADFPWEAGSTLQLEARASASELPGTWGFGFWNDPFGLNLGYGGARLLPALPNAAWFFFASDNNYLSFRSDIPAAGQLAGAYRAAKVPFWVFAPLAIAAPLLLVRGFSRFARRMAARLIQEDAAQMEHDVTEWHAYALVWEADQVRYAIDGREIFTTGFGPQGPLGLVLWLDNQYAAWRPDGRLGYGTLATKPAWIEIKNLKVL